VISAVPWLQIYQKNVPEGRYDRSLARSAWDSATPKSRPVGYGVISIGVRTDSIRCDRAALKRFKFMLCYFTPTKKFVSWQPGISQVCSITSSSSSNTIGHEPFKKSI